MSSNNFRKFQILLMAIIYICMISSVYAFERIPFAKDSARFIPILDKTLYVRNLNFTDEDIRKYQQAKFRRVLKLPLAEAVKKVAFLKDTQNIHLYDYKQKKATNYKVSGFVFFLIFNQPKSSKLSNASLILSNDSKIHQVLNVEYLNRGAITGFGYLGENRQLGDFEETTLTTIPFKDKKIFSNDKDLEFLMQKEIQRTSVFDNSLFIYGVGKTPYVFSVVQFVFTKDFRKFFSFPRDSYSFDLNRKIIYAFKTSNNTIIFRIFENLEEEDRAEYLILCNPSSLELVELGGPFYTSNLED